MSSIPQNYIDYIQRIGQQKLNSLPSLRCNWLRGVNKINNAEWSMVNYGVTVCTSTTRPGGYDGRPIYETDTDLLLIYDGAAWVSVKSGGGTKKIFVPWTHYTGVTLTNDGAFSALLIDATVEGYVYGNIQIPHNFVSSAKVYAVVKITANGNGYAFLGMEYGSVGEATDTHYSYGGGVFNDAIADVITIPSTIDLTNASAGDYVGIRLWADHTYLYGTNYYLYGFILEYES